MTHCSARTDDDERNARLLIERIAHRDRAAFEVFYRGFARRVLAYIGELVETPELAEEAASDTMVAVWQTADRFGGRSRVITWVLGIANHKAIDALRRSSVPASPVESAASCSGGDADPADLLARCDDRIAFERALSTLSPDHRVCLQLMYGFDCSHAEIAQIVGCGVPTVKTRVFYAKRRLRAELRRASAAEQLA